MEVNSLLDRVYVVCAFTCLIIKCVNWIKMHGIKSTW